MGEIGRRLCRSPLEFRGVTLAAKLGLLELSC